MSTRNQAAERLLDEWRDEGHLHLSCLHMLDEALAAERRATVERIRTRIARWPKDGAVRDFLSILDEEAAR